MSLFPAEDAPVPYGVAFVLSGQVAALDSERDGVLPRIVEPAPWWPPICNVIRERAASTPAAPATMLPGRWYEAGPRLAALVTAMDQLGLHAFLDDLSHSSYEMTKPRHALLEWVASDSLRAAVDLAADLLRRDGSALHPIEALVLEAGQADVDQAVDARLDRELAIVADRRKSGIARASTEKGRVRLAQQLAVRVERLRDIFEPLRAERVRVARREALDGLPAPPMVDSDTGRWWKSR